MAGAKRSAGLLPFRRGAAGLEVFLVHPGGPFWAKKDRGAWSLAKGEYGEQEDPLAAACREFAEETGLALPAGAVFTPLGEVRQAGGKVVTAWAVAADLDAAAARGNPFRMEWPPRSGRMREFPEVDRAAWFCLEEAREKLVAGQVPLLERLVALNGGGGPDGG